MTQERKILVVEDEPAIADVLVEYLRHAGYSPSHVADGRVALDEIRRDPPDLVVLDIMLPGMDGTAVCRELRRFSTIPVIMVTARVEEIDRLLGLEVGADDYICKPFSPREVVARITSLFRRMEWGNPVPASGPAQLEIDDAGLRICINGNRLPLTPTEFRLMRLLASSPGRIYTRAQILDLAYHGDQDVSDRIIDSHVKNIRKKISSVWPDVDVIHSVYGIGYRYEIVA
ncbi:Phosphate regulon transcriptional regulatory protein PhoB (SphR) [Paramagnetospirillum magnetotacticum MS-1]|uniref:Phosphate regulon transcriptional regulatory protein PhoB (SphR) n=1 Tax=Paramagnetospirillum magnetotacticum MS-1 TaxID=272627 RepID=A0A0C2YYL9_PARME|nr:response regulator [Paramagnetospirillum magnetotacticum]KIM00174.1 Phosphate regulon transcriptional regulatory protein PhoB (SphR) [Paramagnetospirillum magnetotacticum MS-1]